MYQHQHRRRLRQLHHLLRCLYWLFGTFNLTATFGSDSRKLKSKQLFTA